MPESKIFNALLGFPFRGELPLSLGPLVAFAAGAVLLFSGAGCVVTKTTYDTKSNEADSLREALASANRENAALSKQAAADRETAAALAAQIREKDESLNRLTEENIAARRTYEGSQLTREQFINELLEREKATGKRLQELSARAEGYEQELERMKKDTAARDRERDILAGRVERLQEERRDAERQRDERLAGLSGELSRLSPEIAVYPMGPALRVVVPEKLALVEKGGKLTKLGNALMAKIAGAVVEIPSASLVVVTGGKASAEALREAAAKGKVPEGRLFSHVRARERQTELLVIAP